MLRANDPVEFKLQGDCAGHVRQVLSERVEALTRQIDDLECKAQSLQTTIDRLNVALAQSERDESSHKGQVGD